MKNYRSLYLKIYDDIILNFKKNILNQIRDNWEISESNMMGFKYIEFKYVGNELCKATVFLLEKENGYEIANIVPNEKGKLSYDEYNDILLKFFDECLKTHVEKNNIKLEITSDNVNLENYMTEKAAKKLRTFSSLANKSTGSSHPSDLERWNDFICQVFIDASENVQVILERWLVYLSIEKCTSHPVEKCTIYFSNNFLVSLIL